MTVPPSEPARGPHDEPVVVPLHRPAAIAFALACVPWFFFAALAIVKPHGVVGDALLTTMILLIIAMPPAAFTLSLVTIRRLRAMNDDERPPGLGLARAARALAMTTIVFGVLASVFK